MTQKVFNSIRAAKPSTLYIFNDGPRNGNVEDLKARAEISSIIKQIDWDCTLYKNFAETNLGCGHRAFFNCYFLGI
ncbi:MAG: hypothetical protein IPJ23_05965 [Ignavibacteriales bacterium]|nr:hypothetical protein [Ignavibacteriales bacterium]